MATTSSSKTAQKIAAAKQLTAAQLHPASHAENWKKLGEEEFDVVIIGGGSVGAGSALDAATRGLKVAVVEANDFAAGTSSRSSKMFHGGLRYLAMLDFKLVAEGLEERELAMSVTAPHLVRPLRFFFPLRHRFIERPFMAAGFVLYDMMGGAKSVPKQKHFTRKGALKQAPGLKEDDVVGAIQYYDTLVDDARHTMTVFRTAAHYGATIRTSTQVVGFQKDGQRVTGVEVMDTDTGERTTVKGSVVINATGVWTNEMQELAEVDPTFTVHASKGVHIVVPRSVLDSEVALTYPTSKSVLFVLPWGEYWIIGTTDTDWDHRVDDPAPTATDINYLLNEVNQHVKRQITHADIVGVYSGLRPLLSGKSDSTTKLSRNHAVARVAPGMVSVAGGKYTTYRVIGKDAVDAAVQDIPFNVPESITDRTPLLGANGYYPLENSVETIAKDAGISTKLMEHLLGRYGSLYPEVLAPAIDDPSLLETLEGTDEYIHAEVLYAVTHEGALHLDDILVRRLRLAMEYNHRGSDSAQAAADIAAPILGWSAAQKKQEVAAYIANVDAQKAGEQQVTDQAALEASENAPMFRKNTDVKLASGLSQG